MNPRRPTPSGSEPDPFDQARAPPLFVTLISLRVDLLFIFKLCVDVFVSVVDYFIYLI